MNNSSSSPKERPPRRLPKQKRGKERLEKILIAAAEVFTEVGYAAATTQQIAERANTAIGSIYQFFPDKLAIFHALEEAHYQKILKMLQFVAEADVQQPLKQFISELVDRYTEFLADPISRCVMFQLMQPHIPGLFAIFDEEMLEQQSVGQYADLCQRRNPSLSRDRSELLSEVAHHTFRSLFFVAFKRHNSEYRQAILMELKDLLYTYLDPHLGDRFLNPSDE